MLFFRPNIPQIFPQFQKYSKFSLRLILDYGEACSRDLMLAEILKYCLRCHWPNMYQRLLQNVCQFVVNVCQMFVNWLDFGWNRKVSHISVVFFTSLLSEFSAAVRAITVYCHTPVKHVFSLGNCWDFSCFLISVDGMHKKFVSTPSRSLFQASFLEL